MESRFFYNVDDKSEPFHNEENVSDDISEALMRGVIRDLRASIKNPQDYTARTDPNVPIEEVAGVMAIQNRYSMMARWHEVLFPVLEEFTAEAMDQNQKLLALPQDMAREKNATLAQLSLAWMLCKKPGSYRSDGTFDVSNYYTSREGSTAHVDHANVLYQIPAEETGLPMVFLHGYGQSRMGWMTTPDGREGWSDMFLKMGHSVFLIDQPRRGEAGQTSVAGTINTEPSDQTWYTQFRIGTYLNDEFTYNEGSQFPAGEEALDQFFRQMTPDTGMDNAGGDQNIDNTVVAQAVAATIDEVYARTGKDSILVTHSQGGMPGWETARYTDHIAAIVAIEPGMAPQVDSDDYKALLEKKIPVIFYYGDYIGEEFPDVPAAAMWGFMASTADTFTTSYTAAGGISTVVHLPDEGITGNDHFMFQDMNNDVIAEHIENWIQANVMSAE